MSTQGYTEWFNTIVVHKLNTDVGDKWIEMDKPIKAIISGHDILCSAEAIRAEFGERGLNAFKQVYMPDTGNREKGFTKWTLRQDAHLKLLRYLEKQKLVDKIEERPFSFLGGARYLRMRQVVARTSGRVPKPESEYEFIMAKCSEEEKEQLLDEVTGWHNLNELDHVEDEPWDKSHLYKRETITFKEKAVKIEPVYDSLEEELKVVEQKIKEHTTKGNYVGDLITRRQNLQNRIIAESRRSREDDRPAEGDAREQVVERADL